MTPNNNCGWCAVWLAIDEEGGIPREEAIEKYCNFCENGRITPVPRIEHEREISNIVNRIFTDLYKKCYFDGHNITISRNELEVIAERYGYLRRTNNDN